MSERRSGEDPVVDRRGRLLGETARARRVVARIQEAAALRAELLAHLAREDHRRCERVLLAIRRSAASRR